MKKLLCLLGGAMLFCGLNAQKVIIKPYYIGERVTKFPLTKIVNYEVDSTSISSFGRKLLILDFWGTHCGSCIKSLPEDNDLQNLFKDKVQFILVTSEDSATVADFLTEYNKKHKQLTLPIVTSDDLIQQMFRHSYWPHYVWIGPDGSLLAQTSSAMLTKKGIQSALNDIQKKEEYYRKKNVPEELLHFPSQNSAQKQFFQFYKN